MAKKIAVIFLFLALCLSACSKRHENVTVATWEAKFDFDNELYPSYVLSLSGPRNAKPSDPNYYGDVTGLAEVWIVPSIRNAQAHVSIQIEGWTNPSQLDTTLPEAGKRYRLAPYIEYDFSRLVTIDQSIPAVVNYAVSINGVDLGRKTLPIRIRSVNDVPLVESSSLDGKPRDFTFLFAGYVDESSSTIETILQQALHWKAVNRFVGYQNGPDYVRQQVFAIWNVLQRRHVHYSNITTASASSPTGYVYSQAVRFVDQSFDLQQANCVDGSVLIASILYKIGIYPFLVLKPGHMFVGYWLNEARNQCECLETTKLGAGHQPSQYNQPFGLLHPVKLSESWTQFIEAIQAANQLFNQEVLPAVREHRPHYYIIDIAKARQLGINAIARPSR